MNTLADRIGGKRRIIGGPFGSNLTQKDYVAEGVPIIRGTNMEHHGRWIGGEFAFVNEAKAKALGSNIAHPGDIVVTQRGTLGQVSIIPTTLAYPRYVISQSQMAIAVDSSVADPYYVYYYLRSPTFNGYVANSTIQTGVPHINLGILRDAPALWPTLPEQCAIATTLGSLDDKIELNQRMNETLEAMAQAIFRDWFLDFGPTRRKLDGATDPVTIMGGLVQDAERAQVLADLFPATLGDDGLPEGWNFKPLEESLILQRGFDLPKSLRSDGLYPVIAASGPSGTHSEFKVVAPGVCTGRSGVLGNVFYVQQDFWPLNTSLWIKAYPNATPIYAYFLLKEIDLLALNAGSAVPTLNRNHVHNRPTVTPPMAVVSAYTGLAETLMVKSDQAAKECKTLAATRDLLLPKLMSGEIRLSEAVGAAA